ncbi:MAG: class I SAM-dependent methyltransferase [Spongiibacteraceae bacterium]|nr:class I SAM-dependent methyltransferase [Spongiibacteraceae bacterium]
MDSQTELAVLSSDEYHHCCVKLANRLALPLLAPLDASQLVSCLYPYLLTYTAQGLALQQTGPKAAGPVVVDFLSGASQYRRRSGGGEMIVKAVGGNKQQLPYVLDATAGLGRDSFVLASWAYRVTALERSAVVASLLTDGLERAALSDDLALQEVMARLQMKHVDACEYLSGLQTQDWPDVIYIDPMFPVSKKSALVKKQMRAFHQVVGADQDSAQLLELALQSANYRVVVKRPKKAVFIADKKPSFSLEGKAVRFDVYGLKSYKK